MASLRLRDRPERPILVSLFVKNYEVIIDKCNQTDDCKQKALSLRKYHKIVSISSVKLRFE